MFLNITMSLHKLKTAPLLLIEDTINNNTLPLLLELINQERHTTILFCYEQPILSWKNVFREQPNVIYHEEYNPKEYQNYTTSKCVLIVDSLNQMILNLGWSEFLRNLKKLQENSNVGRIILILHSECINSKIQSHLEHIASGIVTYDSKVSCKIQIQLKKGGKFIKTDEMLKFDEVTRTLKSFPIQKEECKDKTDDADKVLPSNLTTFKIEMDQIDKMDKYKLKLPYMTRTNESKVYYEPDAVDDWDEEDPDEDLDI